MVGWVARDVPCRGDNNTLRARVSFKGKFNDLEDIMAIITEKLAHTKLENREGCLKTSKLVQGMKKG